MSTLFFVTEMKRIADMTEIKMGARALWFLPAWVFT